MSHCSANLPSATRKISISVIRTGLCRLGVNGRRWGTAGTPVNFDSIHRAGKLLASVAAFAKRLSIATEYMRSLAGVLVAVDKGRERGHPSIMITSFPLRRSAPLTGRWPDARQSLPAAGLVRTAGPPTPTQQSSPALAAVPDTSMGTRFSVDRESFQTLLASAFAVQESGLNTQSLSALLELQRSIITGKSNLDRTMQQVADSARNVASATGVAIALLRGDQLVYRAGSGSAATYVGRHVTAIISASAHNHARGEILRVENARTDARIEGAICRQFDAQSLLILPIYPQHALAGVLQVFFSEAHAFQDREVRTYRLMAGLVEDAMSRNAELDQKKVELTPPVTVPQITPQMQKLQNHNKSAPGFAQEHGNGQVGGTATVAPAELLGLCQAAKGATTITQLMKRIPVHKLQWRVAITAVASTLVIAACWIVYDGRQTAPVGTLSPPRSNATRRQILVLPAKLAPSNSAPKVQTAAPGTADTKPHGSAFKRVRVGPNEVDYIAEDVTIRHFTPKAATRRVWDGYKEVQIGEDVTVRDFVSKPLVVSRTSSASTTTQSVNHSLTVSK